MCSYCWVEVLKKKHPGLELRKVWGNGRLHVYFVPPTEPLDLTPPSKHLKAVYESIPEKCVCVKRKPKKKKRELQACLDF